MFRKVYVEFLFSFLCFVTTPPSDVNKSIDNLAPKDTLSHIGIYTLLIHIFDAKGTIDHTFHNEKDFKK